LEGSWFKANLGEKDSETASQPVVGHGGTPWVIPAMQGLQNSSSGRLGKSVRPYLKSKARRTGGMAQWRVPAWQVQD
jgi:hypothetical protein